MPPLKSLKKLATESCIAGIKYLYDVGDCPYEIVRPVLLKLGNPVQLHDIEQASPQIAAEDEEIWRMFIARDIPNGEEWLKERDIVLKEREEGLADDRPTEKKVTRWFKIYQKLRKKADQKATENAASLKAVLNGRAAEKEKNKVILDPELKMPKMPNALVRPQTTNSSSRPQRAVSILDKARRDAKGASAGRKFVNSSIGMVKQSTGHTVFASSRLTPGTSTSAPSVAAPSSSPPPPPQSKEEAQQRRERALAHASARRGDTLHVPTSLKRGASGQPAFVPRVTKQQRIV